MLRPVVLAASILPVLAGQVAVPSRDVGTAAPVKDVTNPPRDEEIEFVDFYFERPQPAHGGVSLFPIDGEPASGIRYPVEAIIGGERAIAALSFDVVAEDGTRLESLPIAWRGTGAPGHSEFIGMMNVPARPFRILLTGQTVDGRSFHGLYERLFRPGKGSLEIPRDAPVPPEFAGQRQRMDEAAKRLVAEVESYAAANAAVPVVLPRVIVSKVMYAPLLSAAGRPIGMRITYDVAFSRGGVFNPQLAVYPEDPEESSGVSAPMRVLNSSLEPTPRLAHPPHAPADTREGDSVLAYGADFLYDARPVYHFMVELVPAFIVSGRGARATCVSRVSFLSTADPGKAFSRMLTREGPRPYRITVGGDTFEGRIEELPGEGTLYRNFVAEGAQDCAQQGR